MRSTDKRLKEIRNEKWLEWCSQLNAHTSLSQLWSYIRRDTGKAKSKTPPHPEPQVEAERLANHFKTRASSTQLPDDTRRENRNNYDRKESPPWIEPARLQLNMMLNSL